MSPLRRGKKEKPKEEETPVKEQPESPSEEIVQEPLTPVAWLSNLLDLADIQGTLHSLPDLDIQLSVGNSLIRFVKKGLEKPAISEERSLRPDVTIRISDKAYAELAKIRDLDEFGTLYRRFAKSPSHEEFVKVSINKESLLSNSGILRSRLFKNLFLV